MNSCYKVQGKGNYHVCQNTRSRSTKHGRKLFCINTLRKNTFFLGLKGGGYEGELVFPNGNVIVFPYHFSIISLNLLKM